MEKRAEQNQLLQEQKLSVRNKFPKSEKLCSRQDISELFEQGDAFLVYPLRCFCRIKINAQTDKANCRPGSYMIKILISVPKRNIRLAVNRNLLKRRIREAYRLNKTSFFSCTTLSDSSERSISIDLALTYIAKGIVDYQTIEDATKKILKEINHRLTGISN